MRTDRVRKDGRRNLTYEIQKDPGWLVREEEKVYGARGDGVFVRKRKRFRLIDVFAGAGGMTLGFSKMYGQVNIRGQIFILDIARWIRTSMRFLLKQTERKVKDKDLTPILTMSYQTNQIISTLRMLLLMYITGGSSCIMTTVRNIAKEAML